MNRGRLMLLLGLLISLAVCWAVVRIPGAIPLPSAKKPALWLSRDGFDRYIEGESIPLPDGGTMTLRKELIETVRIEPGGDGPESAAADVSFIVRGDRGRYAVKGLMTLHRSDQDRFPIVNLGRGWNVTKE